ncbi:uncharacterized protein LOC116287763 isoform X2 [Actinia tenebrosa]|uniref:Uncharacterized protein LOC116287763 isoform X2 n=1 Tax=Actinia tenebrosa TaxID=6105 RepID=A0A6P8HCQ3_ACTTE|nr:uncharacterized protein LOC116287763 isoform X2 [Actinia tenebrosa]
MAYWVDKRNRSVEMGCVSIKETCRKLTARTAGFAVTTPKTMRLSTASFSTYMTKRTTPQYKTDPVLNGENPTSKPNSKAKEKTPFYIIVVIIILGALIFCCCCIVVVAFRRKKKRKKEKNSKKEDKTSNEAAIKTHDSSERSSDSDEFDDSQQEAGEKELSNCLNESNVAISYTNSRDDYTALPLRHEYAEIMIIKDDDNGGGDECDGRERAKHRVRFVCDENERLKNECIRNGKRNHSTSEDYNSNGNYLVENCKKHHGNKKNGSPETTSPPTVNYRKLKGLLKISENNDPRTVEREQQEDNHDMEIVKLDIAVPTKEAQYASIVEIHPHEHDSIINKKPFLKTFAPVNGYRHQNERNFEGYEQNETNYEQNSRDFEHYEQNGRILDQCEQNGRNCDERDLYTSVDKSVHNAHTRPHEEVYAVVDKSKKTNKKAAYSNVRMNYVELADFDKNAALYTKMPPRYQPTRYTEVEIPIEWD